MVTVQSRITVHDKYNRVTVLILLLKSSEQTAACRITHITPKLPIQAVLRVCTILKCPGVDMSLRTQTQQRWSLLAHFADIYKHTRTHAHTHAQLSIHTHTHTHMHNSANAHTHTVNGGMLHISLDGPTQICLGEE